MPWLNPHVGPVLGRHTGFQKLILTVTKRVPPARDAVSALYAGDNALLIGAGIVWAEAAAQIVKTDPKLVDKAAEAHNQLYGQKYTTRTSVEPVAEVEKAVAMFEAVCREAKKK